LREPRRLVGEGDWCDIVDRAPGRDDPYFLPIRVAYTRRRSPSIRPQPKSNPKVVGGTCAVPARDPITEVANRDLLHAFFDTPVNDVLAEGVKDTILIRRERLTYEHRLYYE